MVKIQDDHGDSDKIADFIAALSGLDRADLAFVLIATDWTETEGLKTWSNTPLQEQMIALMHLTLASLTKSFIAAADITLAD